MAVRVMIVDDAAFLRHVAKKQLRREGFEIAAEAGSGEEAVAEYATVRPHVVLLDMTLPGMGSLATLEALRGVDPKAKVVAVAGAGRHASLAEAVKAGALQYTRKPYRAERIRAAIDRALGRPSPRTAT
ncbi:MAG: response regulator [Phycisphaerae bacterium]